VVDSGTTQTIVNNPDILKEKKLKDCIINFLNNNSNKSNVSGKLSIKIGSETINIDDAILFNNGRRNLLSIIDLLDNNINCLFYNKNNKKYLSLFKDNIDQLKLNNIIGGIEIDNGLFKIISNNENLNLKNTQIESNLVEPINDKLNKIIWHNRFLHYDINNLKNKLKDINISLRPCKDCNASKVSILPNKANNLRSTSRGDLIYSDLLEFNKGSKGVEGVNGENYSVIFVDDFSRKIWIHNIKSKRDVGNIVIKFFNYLKTHFDLNIKYFKTDGAPEYSTPLLNELYDSHGTIHITSAPRNPQELGRSERNNRSFENCIKTILRYSNLNLKYWPYAIKSAVDVKNIIPHKGINNKIPDLEWYGPNHIIRYDKLRAFGCFVTYDRQENINKIHTFKKFGINLGRAENANAYKVLDLQSGAVYLRRNVEFYETKFIKTKDIDIFHINKNIVADNIEDLSNIEFYQELILEDIIHDIENNSNNKETNDNNDNSDSESNKENNNQTNNIDNNQDIIKDNTSSSSDYEPLRKNKMKTDVTNDRNVENSTSGADDENVSGVESDIESTYDTSSDELVPLDIKKVNNKRKINTINTSSNDEDYQNNKRIERNPYDTNGEVNYTEAWENLPEIKASDVFIPRSIQEALRSKYKKYWKIAIDEELKNYDVHKTTTKININKIGKNRKLIKLKWIFALKTDEHNRVLKFKARLVAKGYTQKKNVDFFATYSPTLAYESLRYLIAYASRHHYDCYQLDIKGAYLNSNIDTDIYTEIPVSHPDYEEGYCWKLNKALYGLKQAGRLWYEEINNTLTNKLGFTKTYTDSNIYHKSSNVDGKIIIGLYVDDMVIIGATNDILNTINEIKSLYTVSKVEEIDSILGIKINKTEEGEYTMDQTKYITNILNKYNITGEKTNPYSDITDNDENQQRIDPTKFRSAVGSLVHLARCTRPDISETVSKLSTKRNNPTVKDWKKLQNVLKYLNKTRNFYLKFDDKEDIITYSDASFGPKEIDDNAKSTTGYIIYMGSAPISWKSKKQKFTARSTTEAEFNATADLIEKIMWLNNLNKEIEGKVLLCQVFCDNISNIKILTNEKRTNSSRHFDIDYSFVMDYIKEDFINLSYVNTNNMLADILTKRISKDSFEYFIDNTFFY